MKKAYVATIQVLITPIVEQSSAAACDAISETLYDVAEILDWGYLTIGGQTMTPTETFIDDNYAEGDMFNNHSTTQPLNH